MRRVFLDTVGRLATWNSNDQWHDAAAVAMREIGAESCDTFTSEFVLLECGNAAARTSFRTQVVSLRRNLSMAGLLVPISDADIELAWEAYEQREAGGAGIVDQVSFLVMRRLGITEAFTNDEHFRSAGFVTLF